MNHRANIDYLLVTYIASTSSALSSAVGEWARIWPLSRLIRSMGAYFIRRQARDGLYRAVLRRYVQMATEGGVAQAIFPEGGLSRTGRLGAPKLGLLSYIVDGFEPKGPRDVVFVPVGLNYDRVLEDRILLNAAANSTGRAQFNVRKTTVFWNILTYFAARLVGRSHKFGYAAVSFGTPLSLREFVSGKGEEVDVEALGLELTNRIGQIVPVLPTSLVATVMQRAGPLSLAEVTARAKAKSEALVASGSHLHIPREDFDYAVEVGLRALTFRGIVREAEGKYSVVPDEEALLGFYANSLLHLGADGKQTET